MQRMANSSRAEWMLWRLAETGLRLTGPRALVAEAIAERTDTFTTEGLIEELHAHRVSRASVYRTVDLLERLGLVTRMHLEGGNHGYAVCDGGHHHHLLCTACGRVIPIDARAVEREIQALASQLRFRVDTHTLEFAGQCERCQAA